MADPEGEPGGPNPPINNLIAKTWTEILETSVFKTRNSLALYMKHPFISRFDNK